MSAPDVKIETQKHRHRSMVSGIWIGAAVLVFAVVTASIAIFGFGVEPAAVEAVAAPTAGS